MLNQHYIKFQNSLNILSIKHKFYGKPLTRKDSLKLFIYEAFTYKHEYRDKTHDF